MPSLVQDVKAPPERIIRSAKNVTSPVVHLILREGLSSVFEAMVVAPVAKLRERGLDTRLVVFAPIGELFRTNLRRRWRSRMDSINQIYNRPVHRLPSPPARMQRLWSEARILKKWLMSHIGTNKPAILHCRGPEATGLALQVRQEMPQLKVIFDMRGLVDAEYLYDREFTPADLLPANVDAEYHRLKQMQQIALHSADAIFCVSHAMADHAILRLGARAEDVTVLPCAVAKTDREAGDNRRPIRQRLGIEDNFVVAFSGGTQRWQMPRQSV